MACGTSFHAGMVAKYFIEQICRIPCWVEIASEYRYRNPVVPRNTLFVSVSQSGETADTLAALRLAKQAGYLSQLAICNVPESSLVRESELVMLTRAGPGDRRRVDEGLHDAARGARHVRRRAGEVPQRRRRA